MVLKAAMQASALALRSSQGAGASTSHSSRSFDQQRSARASASKGSGGSACCSLSELSTSPQVKEAPKLGYEYGPCTMEVADLSTALGCECDAISKQYPELSRLTALSSSHDSLQSSGTQRAPSSSLTTEGSSPGKKRKRPEVAAGAEQDSPPEGPSSLESLSDDLIHRIVCRLDPESALNVSFVSKRLRGIVQDSEVWRRAMQNSVGEACTAHLSHSYPEVGMDELAKRMMSLQGLRWQTRHVGGKVTPSRCNFSACAVGSRIVMHGGDHCQTALNDTYVLDMSQQEPSWRRVRTRASPPGRFGHTIRRLGETSLVVLFGGCGNSSLLDDAWVLDLDERRPTWREIVASKGPGGSFKNAPAGSAPGIQEHAPPCPRVWHAACTVGQARLVVFGGCTSSGELLNDTHILDVDVASHQEGKSEHRGFVGGTWRRLETAWRPPARIGHSLTSFGDTKVVVFGGIARRKLVRARDNSTFVVDLADVRPCWKKLHQENSSRGRRGAEQLRNEATEPAASKTSASHSHASATSASLGRNLRDSLPSPRLDHVCWSLPDNRQIIFGGSSSTPPMASAGGSVDFSAAKVAKADVFVLDLDKGRGGEAARPSAAWRRLDIQGSGPTSAWTHCSCTTEYGTKCIVLGGSNGEDWVVNELHELSIVSR